MTLAAMLLVGGMVPLMAGSASAAAAATCSASAGTPYKSGTSVKASVSASGSCTGVSYRGELKRHLSINPDMLLSTVTGSGAVSTSVSTKGTAGHQYYSKMMLGNGASQQSGRFTF